MQRIENSWCILRFYTSFLFPYQNEAVCLLEERQFADILVLSFLIKNAESTHKGVN